MNLLDTITLAFQTAIQTGTATLALFSIPLLVILATIAFYVALSPIVMSGGGLGDALGATLLQVIKTGIYFWLLLRLRDIATAALLTFFQWGAAVGNGGVTPVSMLQPSSIVTLGQQAAYPLAAAIDRLGGLWFTKAPWVGLTYIVSSWVMLVSFWFVAVHLAMTLIEFYLAVLVATVLLPFGILMPLAFFAEFAIGFMTGGLVRVFLTVAIVGISVPLFALIALPTDGTDPTASTALLTALSASLFALLAWIIPGRAAAIAGRGVSLALSGSTLLAGAASAGRGALIVQGAIRGISQLVQRARG